MTDVNCPVCGEGLDEIDRRVDGLHNDDGDVIMHAFVVRKFMCINNNRCPLEGKHLHVFFNYNRIEHLSKEINIGKLQRKFEAF